MDCGLGWDAGLTLLRETLGIQIWTQHRSAKPLWAAPRDEYMGLKLPDNEWVVTEGSTSDSTVGSHVPISAGLVIPCPWWLDMSNSRFNRVGSLLLVSESRLEGSAGTHSPGALAPSFPAPGFLRFCSLGRPSRLRRGDVDTGGTQMLSGSQPQSCLIQPFRFSWFEVSHGLRGL